MTEREKAIRKIAKRLERTTLFSAEATEKAAEHFPNLTIAQLEKLLPLVQDFATAMSMGLQAAATRVTGGNGSGNDGKTES